MPKCRRFGLNCKNCSSLPHKKYAMEYLIFYSLFCLKFFIWQNVTFEICLVVFDLHKNGLQLFFGKALKYALKCVSLFCLVFWFLVWYILWYWNLKMYYFFSFIGNIFNALASMIQGHIYTHTYTHTWADVIYLYVPKSRQQSLIFFCFEYFIDAIFPKWRTKDA